MFCFFTLKRIVMYMNQYFCRILLNKTYALMGIIIFSFVAATFVQISYAQTSNPDGVETSEQISLSDDLANNPVAQDILKKIEQTRQWIADLEQRNYEQLEKQQELENKRAQSLIKLNQDLEDWEALWEYYSPHNSFERFVETVPNSSIRDVFWDQFEFKEQKVKAGRDALKKVIASGGSLKEARQAYLTAAETKRIELIEANSQFNVKHNLAYYNQQILFNRDGQFVDSPITGEQLRKYYEDFRTNPAYLEANPNDETSWEDLSRTNQNTECRDGHIVIHRFHARDYICVTMETAELWIQHGMGEITGDSKISNSIDKQSVNPLTRCDDGFVVVYNYETNKYSCVSDETASKWVEQRIAEFPDPEEYIMKSIQQKESILEIEEINHQIRKINETFEDMKIDLKKKYDIQYDELLSESKQAERDVINKYQESSELSKEDLSKMINSIREDYESDKDKVLRDKIDDIKSLEKKLEDKMIEFVETYDDHLYIKVISDFNGTYEAIER